MSLDGLLALAGERGPWAIVLFLLVGGTSGLWVALKRGDVLVKEQHQSIVNNLLQRVEAAEERAKRAEDRIDKFVDGWQESSRAAHLLAKETTKEALNPRKEPSP